MKEFIKGISVLNPDDVELDYYLYTVDYAIEHGFDHLQLIGPIHNYVRGNIDGMIYYKKYAEFNAERDSAYVDMCLESVNIATKKATEHGIKNYMWHHELYLPDNFKQVYPEILNEQGDIEVSHPRVADFITEKINDFFDAYPYMDGIILTLHETSVPLLKLHNQKLGKVERVKHVTKLLYDACIHRGKALIVRPFASLEEDYEMMTAAYEEISPELMIMDKWTQFDWSLAMPGNPFFNKIKKNPLFVEGDVFGEYFGKGRLPLMLLNHLKNQFDYCGGFNTAGYCLRIDRHGQNPFGTVNEVNLEISCALLNGENPEEAALAFFEKKYPGAGKEVMALMQPTEKLVTDAFYIKSYLFSQLSNFQDINHSKNHFYFEMMRENASIASNEWFIPKPWTVPSREEILSVKKAAADEAAALVGKLAVLQEKLEPTAYEELRIKFTNLKYVTEMWYLLAIAFMRYVGCFEGKNSEAEFEAALESILAQRAEGKKTLGDAYYCSINSGVLHKGTKTDSTRVEDFVSDMRESYRIEKEATEKLTAQNLTDFIICGGGMEGHNLQKEVNFSDVLVFDGKLSRLPGTGRGKSFSTINAHGWFSYELALKPDAVNKIEIEASNPDGVLSFTVHFGNAEYTVCKEASGAQVFAFDYTAKAEENKVRIRIDRNWANVPYIHTIKVQ